MSGEGGIEVSLAKFRESHKMTQKEMAEKIGVSISYYTKIESGHKNPSFQFLMKLKASFGGKIDMNVFFEV